jgi:hypothetical protein
MGHKHKTTDHAFFATGYYAETSAERTHSGDLRSNAPRPQVLGRI